MKVSKYSTSLSKKEIPIEIKSPKSAGLENSVGNGRK